MAAKELAHKFQSSFTNQAKHLRSLGREAEYPVVWKDGSAADVRLLFSEIAKDSEFKPYHEGGFNQLLSRRDTTQLGSVIGKRVEYSLEVGWGTVEVITGPYDTLHELAMVHEESVGTLVNASNKLGMSILGYGIQPRTAPSTNLMSPRNRYGVMHEAIGDPWKWFTVTASDQTHVDIGQEEFVTMYNMMNMLTPAVIALCGNSPIYSGRKSEFCSSREGLMQNCGGVTSGRHGIPKGPISSIEHYVERLLDFPFLMVPGNNGVWEKAPSGLTFKDHCNQHGPDWLSFLAHEHYVWHSARPRCKQKTIELRSACQQPWSEHMSACALSLGLVQGAKELERIIIGEIFNGDEKFAWRNMHAWHKHAIHKGLEKESDLKYIGTSDEMAHNIFELVERKDTNELSKLFEERNLNVNQVTQLIMISNNNKDKDTIKGVKRLLEAFGIASGMEKETKSVNTHELLKIILDVSKKAIENRGKGEEVFLEPLYKRYKLGKNPAQQAQSVAAKGGMNALIEYATIKI